MTPTIIFNLWKWEKINCLWFI